MIGYRPGQPVGAVVFDCDGVILESMRAKGDAFRQLFDGEPAHQDAIEAFHHAHGGMSRYEKFDRIYADIRVVNQGIAALAHLGDLLFAAVAVARDHGVDAEQALRRTTSTFADRFERFRDALAARGLDPDAMEPEAVRALFREVR